MFSGYIYAGFSIPLVHCVRAAPEPSALHPSQLSSRAALAASAEGFLPVPCTTGGRKEFCWGRLALGLQRWIQLHSQLSQATEEQNTTTRHQLLVVETLWWHRQGGHLKNACGTGASGCFHHTNKSVCHGTHSQTVYVVPLCVCVCVCLNACLRLWFIFTQISQRSALFPQGSFDD